MNESEVLKEFNLDYCTFKLMSNGIVISEFTPDIHLELSHIKEMLAIGNKIYEIIHKKYAVCTIIPEGLTATKEAREFGTTKEANQCIKASAIIVNSLPHRIIGNFIVKVQKSIVPHKIFNSKEDAFAWLSSIA